MLRLLALLVAFALAVAGCRGCGPTMPGPDAGDDLPVYVAPPKDAGTITLLPTDAGWQWPVWYAADPCPPETFGTSTLLDGGPADVPDGSVEIGFCIALRALSAHALLNGQPAVGTADLRFTAGNYEAQALPTVPPSGDFTVRAMRARYDLLKYHPSGIFPTHQGYAELGQLDLTHDESRTLAAASHLLRGEVTLGTLPFTPTTQPPDVTLGAWGIPSAQSSAVTSQAGSYELALLEGSFGLTLTTPPEATFGTRLVDFPAAHAAIQLDHDQEVDLALPARVVEATLTIDGQPLADRRTGADFHLEFTRPGDRVPSVITEHEGGQPTVSGLVPAGPYGVQLRLERAPDRHLPSEVFNLPVTPYLDLTSQDGTVSAAWTTHHVEGGLAVDGVPVQPNPAYTWNLTMYGFANATDVSFGLIYEVPMDSAAFGLQVLDGNYFVILAIDDNLAPDLVTGWYVVDKYLQVHKDRQLPINVETNLYSGRLLIDGAPPPPGQKAGRLYFFNRDVSHRYSLFYRELRCAPDGSFQVRVPKGAYVVRFEIDRDTFPEYATGIEDLIPRLVVGDAGVQADLRYDTWLVHGPMRVGGAPVPDSIGGEEVGLQLSRADGRRFEWGFEGGRPDYRLRLPRGLYGGTFSITQGAFDGVAFGTAPFGFPIDVHHADPP